MNKIFGVMLSAAVLCGTAGASFAATTDGNCEAQLRKQVQTLQQEVAVLQTAGCNVQSSVPDGSPIPSGG